MSISTKFGACPETSTPPNWTTEAASTTSSCGPIDCPPALSALNLDFHNAGVSEAWIRPTVSLLTTFCTRVLNKPTEMDQSHGSHATDFFRSRTT
ncbi:hypothetical protein EG328_009899 [Venturia inaequalis]|uniref:Uncharacterized protein n=1 Tax=Venturia inaequalis TaxID=5025 RepID=A0A8H3UF58_VENIN|nr:hypothetical protein EG328_009899 [Venturia inaequalis]KAE9968392.1 hypothetical protein EG327_011063 [Venturia inaequalis]